MPSPSPTGSVGEQPELLQDHILSPVPGSSPRKVDLLPILQETQETQETGDDAYLDDVDYSLNDIPSYVPTQLRPQLEPHFAPRPKDRIHEEVADEFSFQKPPKHAPVAYGIPARGNKQCHEAEAKNVERSPRQDQRSPVITTIEHELTARFENDTVARATPPSGQGGGRDLGQHSDGRRLQSTRSPSQNSLVREHTKPDSHCGRTSPSIHSGSPGREQAEPAPPRQEHPPSTHSAPLTRELVAVAPNEIVIQNSETRYAPQLEVDMAMCSPSSLQPTPPRRRELSRQPFQGVDDEPSAKTPAITSMIIAETGPDILCTPRPQSDLIRTSRSYAGLLKVHLPQVGERGCALIPSEGMSPCHPKGGDLSFEPTPRQSRTERAMHSRRNDPSRQAQRQPPTTRGTPIRRPDSQTSNTSKRRSRLSDDPGEKSSPSMSERNVHFDKFRAVFNQMSIYDKNLMYSQKNKISDLNGRIQRRDAVIQESARELKAQAELILRLQEENRALEKQKYATDESASRAGDRLDQLKEKYHVLKNHTNNALKEQQAFYQQTNRKVEQATSEMRGELEAQQASQARIIEEADKLREGFHEKTKQALKDAREHCKNADEQTKSLNDQLELSKRKAAEEMEIRLKLQQQLEAVEKENSIALQKLTQQSRDILNKLSSGHDQSLTKELVLEQHGARLDKIADMLSEQGSNDFGHETLHHVFKGVLDDAMSRLSSDVRATASALRSNMVREIPDQSIRLERIEETCKTISAHFDEAKTSYFWHQKFTEIDAINFEQSALIQDLQHQLLERNGRIVEQWQENQALQELVVSYQSDTEQTARVQAELERLTREANGSKMLQLEKCVIIKKQEQDLATLRQELIIRSDTLEATKEKLTEAQQNQRQYTQMVHDKMEELTEKLDQAERQQTEQEITSERKDETITKLSNDLAAKSGRLQAMEEQLRTVRQDFEQHNQALHEQQAHNLLQAYNNTTEKSETERALLNKQLKVANLANEQLQQELSGRARELQELENQVRDDGLEREEVQRHAAEKEKECQRLLDAATSQMGTLEAERVNLQGQLQSACERNSKLDEDLSDARMAIEETHARFEQATNATQSLIEERAKLQEQLEAAEAEVQRVQQALLEAEHTGSELRAQVDDAVTTEMTNTLKLANDALVAFQSSQNNREKIQDSLGDFSGERLANAKWSEKVSRMRTDQDSATELGGHLKKISAVHERLQEMWKTHSENTAIVSQAAVSTTISEMGSSSAQNPTNMATIILENADRERRVSIMSPAILEGFDIPLSVQQERTTRRGLAAPKSIMKMQSSESLIPETQVPKLKRARSIEIPDSQSQKKAATSRVNVRAPVAYTMYNRRVSSSNSDVDTQPLESQTTQSSLTLESQSQVVLHDLLPETSILSSRTSANGAPNPRPPNATQQRRDMALSRSASKHFSQSSISGQGSAGAISSSSQERRGGPLQRRPSQMITYSQQAAIRAQ